MKQCEIIVGRRDGQYLAGVITLDGNDISYTFDPAYELLMTGIVTDHVIVDDKRIFLQDDPQKWFDSLPREYNNAYLGARILS